MPPLCSKMNIINEKYMESKRFVSKSSNLRVVLRPGISPNPLAGQPGKKMVEYHFVDGVVEVRDPKHIEMMLAHPDCNISFIPVDDSALNQDPFQASRVPSEPPHSITELKFGTPVGRMNVPRVVELPPEILQKIEEIAEKKADQKALELTKKMLPELLKEVLKAGEKKAEESRTELTGSFSETIVEPVSKKRPGRPSKQKKVEDANQPE